MLFIHFIYESSHWLASFRSSSPSVLCFSNSWVIALTHVSQLVVSVVVLLVSCRGSHGNGDWAPCQKMTQSRRCFTLKRLTWASSANAPASQSAPRRAWKPKWTSRWSWTCTQAWRSSPGAWASWVKKTSLQISPTRQPTARHGSWERRRSCFRKKPRL